MEPPLGLLADRGWRRRIVAGGGLAFSAGLAVLALAPSFAVLVVALGLLYPASGAFVSISQATLVDADRPRSERNLARWNIAGAVGAAAGPLFLVAGIPWRAVFTGYAVLGAVLTLAVSRREPPADEDGREPRSLGAAVRMPGVLRWLLLLELESLGTDLLFGFLALYLVDGVGAGPRTAALAVAVCTAAGLAGSVAVARVLPRVDGCRLLRASAAFAAVLFPGFELAPGLAPKLGVAALLAFTTSCWYPISKARLYAALSGMSGTGTSLGTCASVVGLGLPLLLGLLAGRFGLGDALWLCLAAPVALLVGVPRGR